MTDLTDYQWGQLIILATTVGTFLVSEWRAARNRRWAIEDRERNAAEAIAERRAATAEIIAKAAAEAEATRIKTEMIAQTLRRHTEMTAAELREEARIGANELVQQAAVIAAELKTVTTAATEEQRTTGEKLTTLVTEAKVAAADAYKEANSVNVKISDLNERLVAQQQIQAAVPVEAAKTIEKIDQTTERIEGKLDAEPGR